MQPFHVQLWDLLLIQLTNWRWSWRGIVVISTIAPLFSTIAFGFFAANDGANIQGYVLTGTMVMSLLFGTTGRINSHMAFIRLTGQLDFFATLPVSRLALIIATLLAFLLMSLPSVIVIMVVGAAIINIPLQIHPLIIIVIPLIALTLCGLGALIGLLARSIDEANSYSNLAQFTMLFVGPVFIPAEQLPPVLNYLSFLSPATYAASALRYVVLGTVGDLSIWANMLVLTLISIFFLWIVTQRIEWRR